MTAKYRTFALVAALCAALDLVTKAAVESMMRLHESIPVIDGLFSLTYIRNPGAAFGILSASGGLRLPVLFAVTAVAAGVILWMVRTLEPGQRLANFALAMILGGAIGNFVDRVRYGEVIDFLDFYLGEHHWPAFNAADSFITVGVTLLLLSEFFGRKEPGEAAAKGRD